MHVIVFFKYETTFLYPHFYIDTYTGSYMSNHAYRGGNIVYACIYIYVNGNSRILKWRYCTI